jgi:hypothetical protein
MFTIISIVLFAVAIGVAAAAISRGFGDDDWGVAAAFGVAALLLALSGLWVQTHTIVPSQFVGVSRNSVTQELRAPLNPGIVSKPFFGRVYHYPWATSYEQCRTYTPALKGSYGITVNLCFYFNTQGVDWTGEINRTGLFKSEEIFNVWGNSVVSDVARSVKDYTPEELSDNRSAVESAIFENVSQWFAERGVPLLRVSFVNWDFTSPEVAKSFDESIVSQRRITEQTALLEAAKISRERMMYEAETSRMVSEQQKQSLDTLGLEGDAAIEYMWIKLLQDADKVPDVVILGTANQSIAVPVD